MRTKRKELNEMLDKALYELGRWKARSHALARECSILHQKLETYTECTREINKIVDAVLAGLAVSYGKEQEGAFIVTIPAPNVHDLEYDVTTEKDGELYRITVRRKEKGEA